MRKTLLLTATFVVALSGCVAYPVYQQPVARLTPSQSAALANRQLDPAERERLAKLDAQVQQEDQAALAQSYSQAYSQPYVYAAPAPYYAYPYYGYPYYGGFYPWYPGVSLSFGFHRGWGGGHHGWGGRGWGGGGHWHR